MDKNPEDKFTMIDMTEAESVSLEVDSTSKLWLNVDGICAIRIGKVSMLNIENISTGQKGFVNFKEKIRQQIEKDIKAATAKPKKSKRH